MTFIKCQNNEVIIMDYEKLYYTLFNKITDAVNLLEGGGDISDAVSLLKSGQISAEEIYISDDDEKEPHT